jgi:hypothetical protein
MTYKSIFYFGVHDYWNSEEWVNVWHFHESYEDMFYLGKADYTDSFGCSYLVSNPVTEYESFRYGGFVWCNDKPEDVIKEGKAKWEDVDLFAKNNYGEMTES